VKGHRHCRVFLNDLPQNSQSHSAWSSTCQFQISTLRQCSSDFSSENRLHSNRPRQPYSETICTLSSSFRLTSYTTTMSPLQSNYALPCLAVSQSISQSLSQSLRQSVNQPISKSVSPYYSFLVMTPCSVVTEYNFERPRCYQTARCHDSRQNSWLRLENIISLKQSPKLRVG
jgi:hypothetical protein